MPTCPACSGTIIEYSASAGNGFCVSCGTVVEENTIVNEITFGETGSGAAMVQGSYVGQGSRGARMSGPFGNRGSMESREQTMMNANKKIRQISTVLRLPETTAQKAARYYELAVETKFTKGRKSIYVVASCLYVVSREAKSSVMLIDFSDLLRVNIFVLGSTYLALLTSLSLHSSIPPIDPSIYIPRFASLLEFGPETQQVSMDAIRICSRFNRDWLVVGRRPSGICGAALYIAARMNNFRRSVSEIVQVVKIGDTTLRKRLAEFGKTGSAELSVESFRGVWIEEEGAPPAFEKSREKEERERLRAIAVEMDREQQDKREEKAKKRGKKRKRGGTEATNEAEESTNHQPHEQTADTTAEDQIPIDPVLLNTGILAGTIYPAQPSSSPNHNNFGPKPNAPTSTTPSPSKPTKRQKVPAEPLFLSSDEEDEEQSPKPLPRSQSAQLKSPDLVQASKALPRQTDYEKALERSLEDEIGGFVEGMSGLAEQVTKEGSSPDMVANGTIHDPDPGRSSNGEAMVADVTPDDAAPDLQAPDIIPPDVQQQLQSPDHDPEVTPESESDLTFSDDIEKELEALLLSPAEVTIKERVWVELNRDYLVQIALKAEREAKEEREGISTTKVRKKRKASQKPRDTSTPAGATTSESVRRMVKKGTKFSKRINYEAIESLFGSSTTNGISTGPKPSELDNNEPLYTFDKDSDSSVNMQIDGSRYSTPARRSRTPGKEYPYNERHEHPIDGEGSDADGEGELVQIIEEDGGAVGTHKHKTRGRTEETIEEDDGDGGDGDDTYEEYNYDEAYEQEV